MLMSTQDFPAQAALQPLLLALCSFLVTSSPYGSTLSTSFFFFLVFTYILVFSFLSACFLFL
jgi:hypothetical protein